METDVRYYRRRACEEMSAASRAVTPAARERRLHLVNRYLDHLKELNAAPPFDEREMTGMGKSAFGWRASDVKSARA